MEEEEESPDRDAGIDNGVDFVSASEAALEKYGGNDIGDSEDVCCESDILESGIMEPWSSDQVNKIQGLNNKITHHYTPRPLHEKPTGQHSRSHSATELPAPALQPQ